MIVQRISGKRIANWLGVNYFNFANHNLTCVAYPPVIPDSPDEIVVVTLQSGSGMDFERGFEIRNFQVRCRAIQNNPQISEANSMGIDTLLMSLMMPWEPDSAHIIDLGWVGGGPAPMAADDYANRYSWVCNYYCKAATGF
jgi:hypothetical protein